MTLSHTIRFYEICREVWTRLDLLYFDVILDVSLIQSIMVYISDSVFLVHVLILNVVWTSEGVSSMRICLDVGFFFPSLGHWKIFTKNLLHNMLFTENLLHNMSVKCLCLSCFLF